jgi:hypothetical protein
MKKIFSFILVLFLVTNIFALDAKKGHNIYYRNHQANYITVLDELETSQDGNYGLGVAYSKHWTYTYLRENDSYVFIKTLYSEERIRNDEDVTAFTTFIDTYELYFREFWSAIFFDIPGYIHEALVKASIEICEEPVSKVIISFWKQLEYAPLPITETTKWKTKMHEKMAEIAWITKETKNFEE